MATKTGRTKRSEQEIAREALSAANEAVKDLTQEIGGETPEQRQAEELEARRFLERYMQAHMTTEEQVATFVLLGLAMKDRAMADMVMGLLWELVGFCFEDVNWHERVEREDGPESVRDIQAMLNFWRREMLSEDERRAIRQIVTIMDVRPRADGSEPRGEVEQPVDKAQPVPADAMKAQAEHPTPKKKYSSDEKIEDATGRERVVVDWLLKQSYKTKLACCIMHVWLFGDHKTDGIADDILNRWSDEILANIKDPPATLTPEELVMSGVVAETQVWQEND